MSSLDPAGARVFRQLHASGLLILPNVWDAGTARLIEKVGARALATSSAAVAWSHGYPDGDVLPVGLLAATVAEIRRVVKTPLSVDVEGGYSGDVASVGDAVSRVVGEGAVGINIEDGTAPADLLCAKIESAKAAARRLGVDLFINARTDVYLRGLVAADRRVAETLGRAERYRAAGADGIFVPGVTDPAEIRTLAEGVRLPLNVLARAGLPDAAQLQALGVRRLSAGSGIASAVLGRTAALAKGFLDTGASGPLADGAMPYADMNALFEARH
ncbi:MAG TPA: isocitrate lyase/phosphoenolpyruvate mutase family protein [Myxococcaceae bacterium]|nr:isocitrate lyase/phosphoenolpyruvate mutase family protein [Myxococcaceae bacterium]